MISIFSFMAHLLFAEVHYRYLFIPYFRRIDPLSRKQGALFSVDGSARISENKFKSLQIHRSGPVMHNISLLQDDLRYYRSIAAPDDLNHPGKGDVETLPVGEVIGFGKAVGLCLTRTLALAMKSQWQISIVSSPGPGTGRPPLAEFIRSHPELATEQRRGSEAEFIPSFDELYEIFLASGLCSGARTMDREEFLELAGLILERRLYLFPADSSELIEFSYGREGAKALLAGESGADAERYWLTHATWKELEEEVATLLLRLETQTLKNERVHQRWLETFGHLYVPLLELESIYSDISALIEHVRSNPGLSAEELDSLERELLNIRTEAGRDRKREPVQKSSEPGGPGPGGIPWSAAEQNAYEEECKTLLRRIWQLTHPDRIGREGFTEAQQQRLLESYQEAMAWKEKSQLDEYEIGLARRSTSALAIILDRVERIWEEMGLDGESVARVRGKTPEERLAWLEARIVVLDEEIKEIKASILAVAGDRDSREKEACLVSPERIGAVSAHMEERFQWYREQISMKEDELARLLAAEKGGETDA
jgi:hypothetical protein